MSKLPSVDDAPRKPVAKALEKPVPQNTTNPKLEGGYSSQLIAWSRIEVKSLSLPLRQALCAKMCEVQMSGATLSNGQEVRGKRGLLIYLLEQALGVRKAD